MVLRPVTFHDDGKDSFAQMRLVFTADVDGSSEQVPLAYVRWLTARGQSNALSMQCLQLDAMRPSLMGPQVLHADPVSPIVTARPCHATVDVNHFIKCTTAALSAQQADGLLMVSRSDNLLCSF